MTRISQMIISQIQTQLDSDREADKKKITEERETLFLLSSLSFLLFEIHSCIPAFLITNFFSLFFSSEWSQALEIAMSR